MKFTDSYQKKIAKNHLRIISMKCRKHKNEVIIFIVPKNIKKKKKKKKKKSQFFFFCSMECIGITCKRFFI